LTIKCTLRLAGEIIHVIITGDNVMFLDSNNTITTLKGLKFSHVGVLKEFPDLKDNENWRAIALERLENHIKSLEGEMNKINYIADELNKYGGYEKLFYQSAGWRPQKFK
jgi:hypothetical protein